MKVDDSLWNKTDIKSVLSIFPGVLGEFLQQSSPAQIVRAEQFIAHIFWRWYFLKQNLIGGDTTPFEYLHWRKQREQWPKKGQFFPQARLKVESAKSVKINVIVDYITFRKQPVLVDVKRLQQKKSSRFYIDNRYQKDLQFLAKAVKEKPMDEISLLSFYTTTTLYNWYKSDPIMQSSFEAQDWLTFWHQLLYKISQSNEMSTDEVLDRAVYQIRQTYPDYGLDSSQLANFNPSDAHFDHRAQAQYFFWALFCRYILLPLSLYTHLIAPVYIDQSLFRNDVKQLLSKQFEDPIPIYTPCTAICITDFGKQVFDEIKIKKTLL